MLLLFIVYVEKKEEGLRGTPLSRVYLLAAGARDDSKRTSGTFAKWLLGSRKAKGKCCLGLFDLYQSPPPHSATVEVGGGGYRVKVTLLLLCFPLSLGQMQLSLFLSLSATPPPQLAHRDQGPPFKEQNAVMNTRSFSRRWRCPLHLPWACSCSGKFREPGVRGYGVA